ncbi:MAG: type IX secretion system sortase PorU [Bacteroidetes bacterium]|nr:type IX secretion system sortase PorU [Bacteroidota bacterium]
MKKSFFSVLFATITFTVSSQNSVLTSGNWYKLSTTNEGVYKISYSDLQSYGINPVGIDPRNIKLYGNGGGMLPEANNAQKTNDLQEIAVQVIGENDGVFDPSDYILFYGQAPDKWTYDYSTQKFSHTKNSYSNTVNYFITIGNSTGKRITSQNSSTATITNTTNKFDKLIFHELDSINLIQSGRKWFGERLDNPLNYTFNLPDLDLSSSVTINTAVVARSPINSQVDINSGGNISSIPVSSVTISCYSCKYANEGNVSMNFIPSSTTISLALSYTKPDTSSVAWLDYFELITRNNLSKNGNQVLFRDKTAVGSGNITKFQIGNTMSTDKVWEITSHNNVVEQNKTFITGTTEFVLNTDSLREFVVFDDSNLLTPTFVNQISNQNLHGITSPELVIVTHPNFVAAANTLANFHATTDGISTEVVTTEEIYNEFSSGTQDITAINDFMEHLYNQSGSTLKYLLLFGDASYDYKNRITPNTNFVPTYQTINSTDVIGSLTSDDYFGLLDTNEGTWAGTELLDIAIGRLPVKTTQEANDIVNKIIDYKTNLSSFGNWRKTITFIGDDEDGNTHMFQADYLTEMVDTTSCDFWVEKIYLDEFQQDVNGVQQSYQEVEQKIVESFRRGSLIMNYTGHGGGVGLAHENILDTNSLDTLNNTNYPLMILATAEASRFDNPAFTSFGEQFLLQPNAGSIASFSTTRLVFSSPNFALNQSIYQTIFNKVNGTYKTLGEVFKESKNLNATNPNNRNFTLLGDPALTLNFPEYVVNAIHPDTLSSDSTNLITGQIEDENGAVQTWFNGNLIVFIQGNQDTIITLANDGGTPFTFYDRRDTVIYDTVSVANGLFSYNLNLNTAMNHIIGDAIINYYAFNTNTDASGCKDNIYINDILATIKPISATEVNATIFPNPSSNKVTISFDESNNETYQFSLYNNMGQVVFEEKISTNNTFIFSVENLKNGLYYYQLSNNIDKLKTGKLIVQH